MQNLSRILAAAMSDSTTFLFCAAIVVWFVTGSLLTLFQGSTARPAVARFIAVTPNGLATIGVLGTFTGILIGLLDFDVTRIDDSVPHLLAGLKTAFTTSIFGIATAILFRLLRALAPGGGAPEGVSPEAIHAVLLELRDDGRKASVLALQQQTELRRAISSDGDGSLLTQLQKLRATVQDGQAELIQEFRQFATHMVENNQKAIVEALERVIRDFNDNLTEQFGENFKELNRAVHALVLWQENYRGHVEALEARLEDAVAAMQVSRDALEAVRASAQQIPEAIAPLAPVLAGINTQTEAMQAHLETLAELRSKAVAAFPVIEANLNRITTDLSASVNAAVDQSRQALEASGTAQAALLKEHDALLKETGKARDSFAAELTEALKQMSEQSTREFKRHGDLIETAAEDARAAITKTLAAHGDKINDQFKAFDEQMQQEINRTMELFGRNLASVSEKFVSDYTPLTERLQSLVSVGRSV